MNQKTLDLLTRPFLDSEIEWRVTRCGKKDGGAIWAQLAPYVDSRAIMTRLDEVVGPENWEDEYRDIMTPKGPGVVCRLGVKLDKDWIWKEDGADYRTMEPTKSGISDALKRAAVKFGIGRHLYALDSFWAKDVKDGYPPDGVHAVRIYSKEPKINAWCLAPSIGNASLNGMGRAQMIEKVKAGEKKAHKTEHETRNSRQKWMGDNHLENCTDDKLRVYLDHLVEKVRSSAAEAA